jgi:hypothetical protein
MNCSQENFTTGQQVPASGIYEIKHSAHRLSFQVALFKGEVFPRCSRCSGVVFFSLARKFNGLDAAGIPTFRVPLYELAELNEDAEPRNAA